MHSDSPIRTLILATRPEEFRRHLAWAASHTSDLERTVRSAHDVPDWPVRVLATAAAQIGTVLAFPAYNTCEQADIGYTTLARRVMCATSDDTLSADVIVRTIHILHEFLADAITYTVTSVLANPTG